MSISSTVSDAYVRSKGKTLRIGTTASPGANTIPLNATSPLEYWIGETVRPPGSARCRPYGHERVGRVLLRPWRRRSGQPGLYQTGWSPGGSPARRSRPGSPA